MKLWEIQNKLLKLEKEATELRSLRNDAIISEAEDGVTVSALAQATGLSRMHVTRILDSYRAE